MEKRSGFLDTLMALPAGGQSKLAKFVSLQGIFYMVVGAAMSVCPSGLLALISGMPTEQLGLVRVCGFMVVLIGWFYFFGGRTGADSFAMATVADRLVVPIVLMAMVLLADVSLQLAAPFAVLDPVLAFLPGAPGAVNRWGHSVFNARISANIALYTCNDWGLSGGP